MSDFGLFADLLSFYPSSLKLRRDKLGVFFLLLRLL